MGSGRYDNRIGYGRKRGAMDTGDDIRLEELQAHVDQWIQKYGVRYFSELTNLAVLMEEVGELARLFARRYGDQSAKEGEKEGDLADELADILFVVVCLANQTGVDLTEAMVRNLEKKTERDRLRHWRNPKLTQERDSDEDGS
jgi:NTP pyrophosphatase (non-canonical NTP hydrolase)